MPVSGIEHIEPMPNQDTDKTTSNSSRTICRRDIVKAVGASAVGGVAFAGTASACWEEVNFCGCGECVVKVCDPIDLSGTTITVTMFKEGKNGGVTEKDVKATESNFFRFVQKGKGKILALEISHDHFDGVYCNPNTCAEKVRNREDSISLTCENGNGVDVGKGHCGPPNGGNG